LLSDNGKEFSNEIVEKWCKENSVFHKLAIHYYHKSNGRVERANRTVRNAIRKTKGSTKVKLSRIVENYNSMVHRGTGFSPNDAVKRENWSKVKINTKKYNEEFKRKVSKCEKFYQEENVLIRNEHKKCKMDDEFSERGKITKRLYGDVYEVKTELGVKIKRHASQLKPFKKGEVVCRET
jgi:hypothetical protein